MMEAILIESVQSSLRQFMHRNAIFMCERLCAEFPSELNLQLLAGCYLQSNQPYASYHILKGTQMSQSRYLFALSCFQMDLLSEAESALCSANEPNIEAESAVPGGAAGHYLLGQIYRYTDRRKNAIHHFKQALSMDPLLWAAYEELCVLGAAEEATVVFGEVAALCVQNQCLNNDLSSQNLRASSEDHYIITGKNFESENISPRDVRHTNTNSIREIPRHSHGAISSHLLNGGSAHSSYYNTPSPMAAQLSGVAPPPVCKIIPPNCPNSNAVSMDSSPRSTMNSTIQPPRRKFVDEGKLRKISGRLFSDSGPRRSTRLAGETATSNNSGVTGIVGNGISHSSKYNIGGSKIGSSTLRGVTVRKGQSWANECLEEGVRQEVREDSRSSVATSAPSLSVDNRSFEQEGATVSTSGNAVSSSTVLNGTSEILSLLRMFGEGYRLSCLYRCQEALDAYLKLPQKHYNTGWVLSQVGKAYFELVDYLEADRAFSLARLASPYSLEGIDIYSTVLFLLKEDMKLSYLAQEMIATDRLASQSWCAMGNCYSLQKDHETALKNFQRAVKLNSKYAYAHTLCGHEYVALEDYENGIKSYQSALRVDTRHYNAWYGLGMIYLRQEKLEFSEHHFQMAFQIHPRSSVIMSYLGAAYHALKRNNDALQMIEKAVLADKKNPLPMYQKANILMSMERFDEALKVLDELKEYAPRESSIYALMGKIYKRINMYDMAMLNFGLALDLKPPAVDVAQIKAAIEKLHVPDELDDTL